MLHVWLYSQGECGGEVPWLGGSSVLREGRSQDEASMLAELISSDGAPSEAGAELQKLAEEHTLCLGPKTHTVGET